MYSWTCSGKSGHTYLEGVGAFLHLVILPVPSRTKSCDFSPVEVVKMRAYNPKKVVGPTIFYGASRNFLGKMKPILDEDFSSGWPDSSYYVVEGQFSRGLDRGSLPHKSRVKNFGQVSPFAWWEQGLPLVKNQDWWCFTVGKKQLLLYYPPGN